MTSLLKRRALALILTLPLVLGLAGAHAQDMVKRPGQWAQDYSDRKPDPAIRFGTLPNGMRYAIRHNATPQDHTSLRLLIGSGSLEEHDDQQGLAHFLEHMAFRGSTHVPSGDMVRILQRLGLAFGADTNAHTGIDQTVYKFDLPKSDQATLDTGLMLLREIAGELTIDPQELDAERGVILSELRARDTPGYRETVAETAFQLEGQRVASRMPIGLADIIRTAPPAVLREFYEREYRPDNAVLVAVGNIDVAEMERAIRARFGDWAAKQLADADLALGPILRRGAAVHSMVEPALPPSLSLTWVRPYDPAADTIARGKRDIADVIAISVLNRRLDRLEEGTDAPLITAQGGSGNIIRSAALTRINLQPKPGGWLPAMQAAITVVRQLDELGAHPEEIARAATETRTTMRTAAEGAATRTSDRIANAIVRAANDDEVYADPVQDQAEVDTILAALTKADVDDALRRLFSGSGPLVFVAGPAPMPGGDAAVLAALSVGLAQKLADAAQDEAATWPYAPAATPGAVAERHDVDGLGVTEVRFANGVRLMAKPTDFAKDEIRVQIRVGYGRQGMAVAQAKSGWMAGSVPLLRRGGTKELTYEQIEALTAGNRVGMSLSLDDNAFVLSGTTRPADLDRQLQLLQAYMDRPGLRAPAFTRMTAAMRNALPQIGATASGVLGRDAPAALHGGDPRWQAVPSMAELDAAQPGDLAALVGPAFARGPVEVTIVGDVTPERAVAAVAASFGALPARAQRTAPAVAAGPQFPAPGAIVLTHAGRADQAIALVAWPTDGFFADQQIQRVLNVTAAILQTRLTDRLRVAEGVTYSPSVSTSTSRTVAGFGYVYAQVETPVDKLDTFHAELNRLVEALQAAPPTQDEMERAKRPMLEQRIKWLRDNSYWVSALSVAQADARQFEGIRDLVSGTDAVTAEQVMQAARRFLVKDTAFRLTVRPAKG